MNFEVRTLIVGLSAFAAAGLLGSVLVPVLVSRAARVSAGARAVYLTRLRLLPAASAVLAGLAATAAFVVFESRKLESVSWTMIAFAWCGAFLVALSGWRWYRLAAATRRTTRAWFADAEQITLAGINAPVFVADTAFPIVAVIGMLRPRLIIARSVLAACTADELRAVLAHEQGHVNRRDNLRRLALTATPDVLALLPISGRVFTAWHDAAEEAADDDADRVHIDGRLHLASALVKVARIAERTTMPPMLPAAALYTGNNLEVRVRRLLGASVEPQTGRSGLTTLGFVVAFGAMAFATAVPVVHEWIEAAIRHLP